MNIYLKIKIKSLEAEAKLIRKEEIKLNPGSRARKRLRRAISTLTFEESVKVRLQKKLDKLRAGVLNERAQKAFWGLKDHRKNDVRKESRSTFIAYGFLRGRDYSTIEQTNKPVDWDRVESLVKKYGEEAPQVILQRFAEWKDAATA